MTQDTRPERRDGRRLLGTTARRVAIAMFITALIPLVAGSFTARALLARVSATAFQPEFGAHLDQALGVYADLARSLKAEMRAEADAVASSPRLWAGAQARDQAAIDGELARAFVDHAALVELRLETCDGQPLGHRSRDKAVDPETERSLTVALTPFWISSESAPITPGPWASVEARATMFCTVAHGELDDATASAGVASTASAPPTMARLETAVPRTTRRMRAALAAPTL